MGRAYRKVLGTAGRLSFTSAVAEFPRLVRSIVDPYRPELYYMRGPGPKWRAKHAVAVVAPPAHGVLARVKG